MTDEEMNELAEEIVEGHRLEQAIKELEGSSDDGGDGGNGGDGGIDGPQIKPPHTPLTP